MQKNDVLKHEDALVRVLAIEAECHKITADQHQYERIILNDRTIKKAALEDTASSLANFLITH